MYSENNKKISITYLFKKGRRKRLENIENIPSEFFYGYKELLEERSFNLNFLEEVELNLEIGNVFLKKFLNFLSKTILNLPFNGVFGFLINKSYKKLNSTDYIIATTNTLGIILCVAKKLNLLNAKILFINMGLLPFKPNKINLIFYKYLLKNIKLLLLSKTEYQILKLIFKDKVRYFPFGVDSNFWLPNKKKGNTKYVLAIGNDLARDWETLEKSWDESFPLLKIITSLPFKTNKLNIEIINGNWHSQFLSDVEMRDLYVNSEFVILPLKQTFQPSGQSTCLQAMACSKAVLISDIKGIWDRKLMKHKRNIFFVKPEDSKELNKGIKILINDIKMRKNIEGQGRLLVENYFNVINMKKSLKKIIEEN